MKRILPLVALLALTAGCSEPEQPPAKRDRAGQPVTATPAPAPPPPVPAAAAEPEARPAPPAPAADPKSAAGAADVLRHYHASIAAGDYAAAYRLWQGEGAAADMSAADFAASFAKYATYAAAVGTPGPLDSGAGNVYVEIPVRITGQLRSGGTFRMEGPMRLHRVNDVPGSSPAQRTWQIVASGIRPR